MNVDRIESGSVPVTPSLLPFERAFRRWTEERGVEWSSLRLPVGADGSVTTAYRFTPPVTPRRRVFTLHGAGNDALFAWIGLFKRLLAEGTEIFTFDLPGHGRFNDTLFSSAAASAAVGAAIDECTRDLEGVPIHGLGVSLGGSVLLRALVDLQSRIASAVLVVAPLSIEMSARSVAAEVGPRTLALIWRERQHYGLTGLIPSFGSYKRHIYPLRLAGEAPPGKFGYVQALNESLTSMELEEAARQVRLPVLLVYGERDHVVPIEQAERLLQALPFGELLRIRRGTHLSTPLEAESTEGIMRWLEAHG